MMSIKKGLGVLVTAGLMGIANPTFAAGFQIQEQSAAGLGTAYAGVGSIAEDASTAFYNSAGLTRLNEEQVVFSAVGIFPNAKLRPTLATDSSGVPIALRPTKARGDSLVPGFYYAKRLTDCMVFGFAATSPFGLKTKYGHHSSARNLATHTELVTVDLAPSIAFAVGCGFSVGVGVDFLYADAQLNSKVGRTFRGITLTDGFQENRADDWGLGYHAGILYELCESTRVGLNFRSKIDITARGESIARLPSLPISALSPETHQKVRAHVTLPETALLSVYHDFCNQWAIMVDGQWTRWNRFKHLTLRYQSLAPLAGTTLTTPEHYKNAYRVALGVIRTFDDCWKLRLGTAYDRSPTPQKFRTARIPDSNRVWLGIGAQYRLNACMVLDAGYGHLFFKKARLDEVAPLLSTGRPASDARLVGKYKTNVNLFGLQFTWDIA